MKRLAILGSTGSIGTQTLEVVAQHREQLSVLALAAGRNVDLLAQQVKQFGPELVCVAGPAEAARLREALGEPAPPIRCGREGLLEVARSRADLVVGALVGGVGLEPVLAALEQGSDIALANKEVLAIGGALVTREARRHGARILPLDSEHVAIAQCLSGHARESLRRVVLTASGGPFRTWSLEQISRATPEQALAHPNWDMGPKISIDSATLMNKGLEVIEAQWLFGLAAEEIEVLIHPESLVHSLVEFVDGSWLAQLSIPDMRVPIAYTLGMPGRLAQPLLRPLDLIAVGALRFEAPDTRRFPALRLCAQAAAAGGTAPALLSAANEVAVAAFLAGEIGFGEIAAAVESVLDAEQVRPGLELAELLEADRAARARARHFIEEGRA